MINYQTGSDTSQLSQIIVTMSELKSCCKWFLRVWLTARRPLKHPYRQQINLWVFILTYYSTLKCWSSLRKWEYIVKQLDWIRHLKAWVSKTLTYCFAYQEFQQHWHWRIFSFWNNMINTVNLGNKMKRHIKRIYLMAKQLFLKTQKINLIGIYIAAGLQDFLTDPV